MRTIKHVFKGFIRISKFALSYLLSLFVLTIVFGLIYSFLGVATPLTFSVNVVWGNPVIPPSVASFTIAHKIIYDVFLVFLIGTYISQRMKPINPIEFSKYIGFDDEDNHYSFRYWIVFPQGSFLYNPIVRVLVTDKPELNRGVNKLSSYFEKEAQYNSFRGVRHFQISGEDAKELSKAIESSADRIISFMIIGSNTDGTTYSSIKHYSKDDIKYGCEFVSVRESEYLKQADLLQGQLRKRNHRKPNNRKKDRMRYQYFDKLYRIRNKQNKRERIRKNEKDVLLKKQIVYGEYYGPKQWLIDLLSTISAHYLERK